MSIVVVYSKTGDVLPYVIGRDMKDASIPLDKLAWFPASEQVEVSYNDSATSGDITAGAAIVASHDGTDPWDAVRDGAEGQASSIPNWAHWTEAQAEVWWDTNIDTPIASAPTVTAGNVVAVVQGMITILGYMSTMLWALARMVIALRNKTWPNLQN